MPEIAKKITGEAIISPEILAEIKKEVKNIPNFREKIKASSGKELTEILEIVLGSAITLDTSDIHIEPEADQVKLRIRIDGVLQDVMFLDQKTYQSLLSRIKLLSGIKINITDRPQDGRFSVSIEGAGIEIRVSTLPAEYGESIVLRILNPKTLIELEALGLRKDLSEAFEKEIKKPTGMIAVTGPTGSGKTTTLYAVLRKINRPEIKIITIEDPIEYHLEGVSQTQVNPAEGYDFASGLKSIMRQDPDVILVGEIRDFETAKIALQAALTGHLVLSTLHTNDAAGAISRLQSLGENPVNIAPAINIIIAQRLVRKVCQKCKKLEKISPQELTNIKKALRNIPKNIVKYPKSLKIPRAIGCEDCNLTGYRGRTGLFEGFLVSPEMEKFILTSPPISALRERIIKKGMITMYQDGLLKVLEGTTTIDEVERVIKPIK